jgi:hypothetical protein
MCKESKALDCFGKYTSSLDGYRTNCKVCANAASQAWKKANPGKAKAASRAWKKVNPGKAKAAKDAWRKANPGKANAWGKANPDKLKAVIKAWHKANPGKRAAFSNKRRAVKLQAIPKWFDKEKVDLVYAKAKEWDMHVDHVIPLQGKNVCGLHVWENLQLLHPSLNSSKGNKYYD